MTTDPGWRYWRGEWYTNFTELEAVGSRIGIMTCLRCGAALMLDPREQDHPRDLHDAWHEALDDD